MKSYSKNFSGILLAGGKSTRMGENKAFIKFKGKYLYEYSLEILTHCASDILISSNDPRFDLTPYARYEDEIQGIGPIGGLMTCLKKIKTSYSIILPCDTPLLTKEIVDSLIIRHSILDDITVAVNDQQNPEPLIGIYSSAIVPVLVNMVNEGKYSLKSLFPLVKAKFVKIPDLHRKIFANINTPQDLNSLRN